ncbi:TPA: hypothetical protein ACTXXA_001087 [Legionella anisa]
MVSKAHAGFPGVTMLQITPQHRLLLAVEPADFRKGIDGLKALCHQKLLDDPFSGAYLSLPIACEPQ